MSKSFTMILPSLLAGGLLFGSALTGAQPVPTPAPPPAPAPLAVPPPAPPVPPAKPAKPPTPPKPVKGAQVRIDLDNIEELVDDSIEQALDAIRDDDDIPPAIRDAVKQRLEKVRVKVKGRLAKLDRKDFDGLEVELEHMGEELGREMEQFGKEMEKFGKQFERQIEKKVDAQMRRHKVIIKNGHVVTPFGPSGSAHVVTPFGHQGGVTVVSPFDDHDDLPDMSDLDDLDDVSDALKSMGKLKLAPAQRQQLRQLREQSDTQVETARKQLDNASETLRSQLENGKTSEQDIARSIDNVTKAEADIRKARILAWVKARRVLDDSQRKQVEAAAGKSK